MRGIVNNLGRNVSQHFLQETDVIGMSVGYYNVFYFFFSNAEFLEFFAEDFKKAYNSGLLKDEFFKRINKKDFMTLINEPQKYLKILKRTELNNKLKRIRQNIITLNFKNGKIDMTLFGRQVL